MREPASKDTTERVGPLAMHVAVAPADAESAARWENRAELLAEWLIARWRRARAQGATLSEPDMEA